MPESLLHMRPVQWRGLMLLGIAALAGAIHVSDGSLCAASVFGLTVSIACVLAGIVRMRCSPHEVVQPTELFVLRAILVVQFGLLLMSNPAAGFLWSGGGVPWMFLFAIAVAAVSALCSTFVSHRLGAMAFGVVLGCHLLTGCWFLHHTHHEPIDVLMFQQEGADALLNGINPYSLRFRDPYSPEVSAFVYGPGVSVDGRLTVGFPYPPLSLFLAAAANWPGDVRYAHLLAMTIAAALIGWARPGRWSYGVAAMFLFTPRVFLVLGCSWTEPFVVLMLAGVIFCACRRPRAVPWMFGLLLAVKQYVVLGLPLVALLLPAGFRWKDVRGFLWRSIGVGLAVTLPLALWNVRDFSHSTFVWLLNQPFRPDALGYLGWIFGSHAPPPIVSLGVPLLVASCGIVFALRYCPRTASGFALAVGIVFLLFFCVNRQSLVNYYYFVIGALCCGLAVAGSSGENDHAAGKVTEEVSHSQC